jgi:hypothetical protein
MAPYRIVIKVEASFSALVNPLSYKEAFPKAKKPHNRVALGFHV